MCQHELDSALFAKEAPGTAQRRYAVLAELGRFAQAPGDIFQSLDYRDTLPHQLLGALVRSKRLTFEKEHDLRMEENRAL